MKNQMRSHVEPGVTFALKHLMGVDDLHHVVEVAMSLLREKLELKEVGSTAKRTRARTSIHDVDCIVIFKDSSKKPRALRDELYGTCSLLADKLREKLKGSIVRPVRHSRTVKVSIQLQERRVVFDLMPALRGETDGCFLVPNEQNGWKPQEKLEEIRSLDGPGIRNAVLLGKVVKDCYFPSLLPSCAFDFAVISMTSNGLFALPSGQSENVCTAIIVYKIFSFLALSVEGHFSLPHLHGRENMIPAKKGSQTVLSKALRGVLQMLKEWIESESAKDMDLFLILTNQSKPQWTENRWIPKTALGEIWLLSDTCEFVLQSKTLSSKS